MMMTSDNDIFVAASHACNKCDYVTSRKNDLQKHMLTKKHKMVTSAIKLAPQTHESQMHECECGKKYKHRQGLYVHRKTCNLKQPSAGEITNLEMAKQNQELKNIIINLIKCKHTCACNMCD